MKYDKLVRDRVPEIIEQNGKKCVIKKIYANTVFEKYLKKKLQEEVEEFLNAETPKEQIEELADIYEVLDTLVEVKKARGKVYGVRTNKYLSRGAFNDRIVLLEVEEMLHNET